MKADKIFAISIHFVVEEYDSIDSAKNSQPLAIVTELNGVPYKSNQGIEYATKMYYFQNTVDGLCSIRNWKIKHSLRAFYNVSRYTDGWCGLKAGSFSSEQWGIENEFEIIDPLGKVKRISFSNLEDLFRNMKFYTDFNSWTEVALRIENIQLKKQVEELQKAQS